MLQKNTQKKKIGAKFGIILAILAILISLTGCSEKDKLVGEYMGTMGSFIKLNKDGTCIYSESDSTGTGTGTWYVEDEMIYIEVSNINFLVYGSTESSEDGLFLEGESSTWTAEYFQKVK